MHSWARVPSPQSAANVIAAALLAGCAATVQRTDPASVTAATVNIPSESTQRVVLSMQLDPRHPQDAGWKSFKQEWIDIMQERASEQGLKFAVQDGDPKPTGEAGTLMVVRVNDYRHVGIGSRIMLGIMTGNAFIDAKIEFRDLKVGTLYGEREYNTSSSAWHGVFAAVTPKQIYAIADETLAEIKRR
jgi:hypothetical protein